MRHFVIPSLMIKSVAAALCVTVGLPGVALSASETGTYGERGEKYRAALSQLKIIDGEVFFEPGMKLGEAVVGVAKQLRQDVSANTELGPEAMFDISLKMSAYEDASDAADYLIGLGVTPELSSAQRQAALEAMRHYLTAFDEAKATIKDFAKQNGVAGCTDLTEVPHPKSVMERRMREYSEETYREMVPDLEGDGVSDLADIRQALGKLCKTPAALPASSDPDHRLRRPA